MLTFGLIFTAGQNLIAQSTISDPPRSNNENSPYSRYGIGDMTSPFDAGRRAMGGTGVAAYSPYNVIDLNPATYTFLAGAALDFGIEGRQRTVFIDSQTTKSGTGDFAYFNMGIKIGKHVGLAFGFKPIAEMYYNAQDSSKEIGLGDVVNNYNGLGNLQYAYLGLAGRVGGLSVGANFGYAFGTYDYNTNLQSVDTGDIFGHVRNSQKTISDAIGGIYWNAGALYSIHFKKDKYFNLGLSTTISQKLNVKRNTLFVGNSSILTDAGLLQTIYDTVSNVAEKGKMTLPALYNFGIAVGGEMHWEIAADFNYTDWSLFNKMGDRSNISDNSWRASIGGSIIPGGGGNSVNKKYFSFITYRLGAYYGKDYFRFGNTDVKYYGGTFGIALPLQRNYSGFGTVSFTLDVGQRGSLTNGLAKENYINFIFGLSLNDSYWLKRPARYD